MNTKIVKAWLYLKTNKTIKLSLEELGNILFMMVNFFSSVLVNGII